MKSVISSTFDDKYLFFLPITTWCWNRLGVDVICFMPPIDFRSKEKVDLIRKVLKEQKLSLRMEYFISTIQKEATYAQCSRLYGACLDLQEKEVLITGDVDMAVFSLPSFCILTDGMMVYGSDLVPQGQYPMCYLSGTVNQWKNTFDLSGKTYQQCLDDLLGNIEAEHFKGNYWGKDQEEAYSKISKVGGYLVERAREGTQFATKRYDRDDSFFLARLSPDTIDFHMPRPGYDSHNFDIILKVLQYHYPNEDFTWLTTFTEEYKKIL